MKKVIVEKVVEKAVKEGVTKGVIYIAANHMGIKGALYMGATELVGGSSISTATYLIGSSITGFIGVSASPMLVGGVVIAGVSLGLNYGINKALEKGKK